jgi:hypothetical protein
MNKTTTLFIYVISYLVVSVVVGLILGFIFKIFYPKINLALINAIGIFLTFVILYSYFKIP